MLFVLQCESVYVLMTINMSGAPRSGCVASAVSASVNKREKGRILWLYPTSVITESSVSNSTMLCGVVRLNERKKINGIVKAKANAVCRVTFHARGNVTYISVGIEIDASIGTRKISIYVIAIPVIRERLTTNPYCPI